MGTKKEDRALVFIFKTVLIGQVLVLNQKEKKKKEKKKKKERNLLLWHHTKARTDLVLVSLLCRQFLVVERTVTLF